MPDIMHLVVIDAPAERVYDALTSADGIQTWWTRDAALECRVGGKGSFGFYDRRFVIGVSIEDLRRERVAWYVTNAKPSWANTTIVFDLEPEDRTATRVRFSHCGFREADVEYASASTRWAYYLFSLKRAVEDGLGTPHPDDPDF